MPEQQYISKFNDYKSLSAKNGFQLSSLITNSAKFRRVVEFVITRAKKDNLKIDLTRKTYKRNPLT